MKANELRKKGDGDLQKQLLELRKEGFNLRMQSATAQNAKPHLFRKLRRDIARIKTVLNEKAAAANSAE